MRMCTRGKHWLKISIRQELKYQDFFEIMMMKGKYYPGSSNTAMAPQGAGKHRNLLVNLSINTKSSLES